MIYKVLKKGNNRYFNTETRNFDYELEYTYVSFEEESITEYKNDDIVEKDGEFISISGIGQEKSFFYSARSIYDDVSNFPIYWEKITLEFYQNENSEYGEMHFKFQYMMDEVLYVTKSQFDSIILFYNSRNDKREKERLLIQSFIDEKALSIAENLVDNLDEHTFFYILVLRHLYLYSANAFFDGSWGRSQYDYYDASYRALSKLKGKEKKQAEKTYEYIKNKLSKAIEYMTGFAKIIESEKHINRFIAMAVAWEAIRQKTILIYSEQWKNEYGGFLDCSFELTDANDHKEAKKEYIKNIFECGKIDISQAEYRLFYYFISKEPSEIYDIGEYFCECEKLIQEIESEINADDIRSKLLTKHARKPSKYTIDEIDLMSGTEFEEFISFMFSKMGYTTHLTPPTGDQGIDVIAIKNNIRIGIQAKCYTNSVSNAAVQEVVAGKGFYSCDKAMVITNNYFTSSAVSLAESNNVVLWDRNFLKMKIKEVFK